jgi:phosphoglycolate phosphatase-like HAD superfamily hydrolase
MPRPKKSKRLDVDVIAFDWDGTLFNNVNASYETNRGLLKRYTGRDLGFNEWQAMAAKCTDLISFCAMNGIKESPQKLEEEFYGLYGEACEANVPSLFRDTECALRELRELGVKLSILSNSHICEDEIGAFGIRGYFSFIHKGAKDKTLALRELSRRYVLPAARIAYVDDIPAGIQHAKDAGVVSIGRLGGYVRDYYMRMAKPDYTIRELKELPAMLRV